MASILSLAGAESMNFLAPPSRCLAQSALEVNIPVDSITISTPSDFQGNFEGLFPLTTGHLCHLPLMTFLLPLYFHQTCHVLNRILITLPMILSRQGHLLL